MLVFESVFEKYLTKLCFKNNVLPKTNILAFKVLGYCIDLSPVTLEKSLQVILFNIIGFLAY